MTPLLVHYKTVGERESEVTEVLHGELNDLSVGGAFVRSLRPPPAGARIELEILDGSPQPIILRGIVVHCMTLDFDLGIIHSSTDPAARIAHHPGFAVAFDELENGLRARLEKVVDRGRTGFVPR